MNKETYEYHGEIYEIVKAAYLGDSRRDLTTGRIYKGFLLKPDTFIVLADDAGDKHEINNFTNIGIYNYTMVNKKRYIIIGA